MFSQSSATASLLLFNHIWELTPVKLLSQQKQKYYW